jgi:type IV pilus assembly protein PilY1
MKFFYLKLLQAAQLLVVGSIFCAALTTAQAVTIPNQPLTVQTPAAPLIMLALGRDHRMFYEAYNDASDIDGDGTLDIRFKPAITYLGLFDSNVCYTHNGSNNNAGLFTPSAAAIGALKTCPTATTGVNSLWSGNWLNYITTSRIDALRVVLYGGMRDVDTANQTVLRRAYIPQDAHSWAKEYTSETVDGYRISNYTPLAQPNTNRRHFFGNLTPNASVDCDPLNNCSNLAPWLSVVTNSNLRVWEWASTERPVLNGNAGGTRTNYTVRAEVCTSAFNNGCKLYPSGNYKPVGLLHDYGENNAALFGLFSGSYDSHLSGGRLRKVMSSFTNEVTPSNGTFVTNAGGIVQNMNAFRLYGFNRGRTDQIYTGSVIGSRTINQGEFPDWGNPVAELMYEATRYLANKGVATSAYVNNNAGNAINTIDDLMGLSRPTWDRPYKGQGTSTAEAPFCAKANLLTISDTNISFDSDQLPGVNANFGAGISTDLSGLNVSAIADVISANESDIAGLKFIGQSASVFDSAPTAKSVASLSSIRGLAPEEPTKRGSYYAASVSHFSRVNDLNPGLQGRQTVDNFFVALASPLPRIEAKLSGGRSMTIVPFAKSISGAFGITNAATAFQPTNQIVDFYVQSIANSGPADANPAINDGRYEAVFRINYEDVEQGNDHDMDAIVLYRVRATADNRLEVTLQPIYEAGGVKHRMGYILSGSTQDGIYLVVQDESEAMPYFLNVPPGRTPGYCNTSPIPGDCQRLPYLGGTTTGPALPSSASATSAISQFIFTPSSTPAATFLKDPMWYAAKWGGFTEVNNNNRPDLTQEWDADGDGQPDTYFFVQNPTKLKDSLRKAFSSITERNSSSSNLAANNSTSLDSNTFAYRAQYTAGKWIGELEAYAVTTAGVALAPSWRASERLPLWSTRNIFFQASDGTVRNLITNGFAGLPTSDQSDLVNQDTLNYIRGDRSREIAGGGTFRNRDVVIGDIIHSAPDYDPVTDTIYIGSNGGMLHAFNGTTGVEKFAFIPTQVVPRLKNLTSSNYTNNHEYFVDGNVYRTGRFVQTDRQSYVYALLGRGGKGLFSINPNLTSTATVTINPTLLWDYTPRGTTTAANDPDLGFMLSNPMFTVFNNGQAGLVAGNGYNSQSGKAVLYIFLINKNGTLARVLTIPTSVAGDNGLSGPVASDINANGTADYIYAGDLKGNVWKFDVSSVDPNDWKLAYTGNQPFFKATDAAGNPQPITAQMSAEFNSYGTDANLGKLFLYIGTGSYFQAGDNNNLSVQSMYGLIEDRATPIASPTTPTRNNLKERTITGYGTINSQVVRNISSADPNDTANLRGWYIDFKNPVNGERVFTRAKIAPVSRPTVVFSSSYPEAADICTPSGFTYLNAVDSFTGGAVPPDPAGRGIFRDRGLASGLRFDGIGTEPIFVGNQARSRTEISGVGDTLFRDSNTPPTFTCDKNCKSDEAKHLTDTVAESLTSKPPCLEDASGLNNLDRPQSDGRPIGQTGLESSCGSPFRGRISWREIVRD